MRYLILAAAAAHAMTSSPPQQPSQSTAREIQGAVEVDAVFMAPDTCHRIINAGPGAPEGREVSGEAIAATVRIAREEGGCEQQAVPLRAPFALPDKDGHVQAVEIFYIDRAGRVLATETVRIAR